MKKLMTMMLGLALLTGAVATVSFAQDQKEETKKKKKKGKKGDETPKKELR
jgi:hypothetical protein